MKAITVIFTLVALRLALFASPIPRYIQDDYQLASPVTSFIRLKEGIFLSEKGIDPYTGGVFLHSPLFLALFSTIFPLSSFGSAILWSILDGITAWCLVCLWRARSSIRDDRKEVLISVIHMLNPYNLLPTLARSTSTIETSLTVLALLFACQKRTGPALVALAAIVHISLPSVLIVVPTIMVLADPHAPASTLANPTPGAKGKRKTPSTPRNNLACGSYRIMELGMEVLGCSAHPLIYIAPICMKFRRDPFYAAYLLLGISATLKSYPTLADPGLFISLISLFPETFAYMRHPLPTFLLHLHSALLMPLASHLWLSQGTGNANFLYAATLVFGLANLAMVVDAVWAGLRAAFVTEEGEEVVQL
ncbi:GPI transamidase subunit PIG-U [Rhizoctonia solani]|uniref:GPI transamidase subunit PIG-U n=1 Tax=Rhizoctonia solani TaxID=456999 RepID=A0A8H7M6E8_9AGAM|nr:GPI transamidase subunit PIG-U [Rhizoctonia solani]